MKYFCFIFLICMLMSCSAKKKVVTPSKTPIATPKTENLDTVPTRTTEVIKMTDDLYVPDSKHDIKVLEKPTLEHDTILLFPETFNHSTWNNLLKQFVTTNGNVNYKGFNKDRAKLSKYIVQLGNNIPNNNWTKPNKLAYWINAYNAMTVDLILRHYPIKSIKDIKDPWKQRHWKLGDKWYNLDEIEHQILRKMNEPRIHFAIVCASYSCPKLQNKAFTSSNIDKQLTKATKEFLNDPERNSISKNNLELSKIFLWFAKDFKQNGLLIDFLNKYTDTEISKNAKRRFKDYSWSLNE